VAGESTRVAAGKRERLVVSAADLMYRNGVASPSLSDVAHAAGIPLGNVYYYFKTRDELVESVIDARVEELRGFLRSLDARPDPGARLRALARSWVANREEIAANGCPFGSLCSDLNKHDRGLDARAAALLTEALDWLTEQFRQLGQAEPRASATTMLAAVQGAALLTNTLRDPRIMATEVRRLDRWIAALESPQRSPAPTAKKTRPRVPPREKRRSES
jgi:AcrR family transcriptional regulator